MILYMPKELKTFSVKIDSRILTTIYLQGFKWQTLNYINITKTIQKGISESKGPSVLTFLFDDIDDIPQEVIELAGITREELDHEGSIGNIIS